MFMSLKKGILVRSCTSQQRNKTKQQKKDALNGIIIKNDKKRP